MIFNFTFVLKENKNENLDKINLYIFLKNVFVDFQYIKFKNRYFLFDKNTLIRNLYYHN